MNVLGIDVGYAHLMAAKESVVKMKVICGNGDCHEKPAM